MFTESPLLLILGYIGSFSDVSDTPSNVMVYGNIKLALLGQHRITWLYHTFNIVDILQLFTLTIQVEVDDWVAKKKSKDSLEEFRQITSFLSVSY
jgi:hypothetical protein